MLHIIPQSQKTLRLNDIEQDQTFMTQITVEIDPYLQAGEYLLIAGMYLLETGERLPLVEGPIAPSPNGILLGTMTFEDE